MKRDGLRVDIKKDGGFFNKKSRPKWYLQIGTVGSRSDGSGRLGSRSNLGRGFEIERPQAVGGYIDRKKSTMTHIHDLPTVLEIRAVGFF